MIDRIVNLFGLDDWPIVNLVMLILCMLLLLVIIIIVLIDRGYSDMLLFVAVTALAIWIVQGRNV